MESSQLNNHIIVKAISKEGKVFLKGTKKIPLRKEEELRGFRR